jgi:tetratricopeptide (TPR) repeat protein
VLAICLTLICNPATAVTTAANNAFRAGVTAFRSRQYPRALEEFQQARAAGMVTSALRFDLGVTYYRLERFAEAQTEFSELSHDPTRAPLAHYNLGLVALKLGHTEAARNEFEHAYLLTRDVTLESLAQQQLENLGSKVPVIRRWQAYASLSAGYDDNVALTSSSSLLTASQTGSTALSILAGGSRQIAGTYRNAFEINGSLYHIEYPALTAYSQNYLRISVPYRFRRGAWSGALGPQAGYLTLGGSSFETLGGVKADVRRAMSTHSAFQLGYRYDEIVGGSAYHYVSGQRHSLEIEYLTSFYQLHTAFGYRFEFNQRNDLKRGTRFFSVSPTRQRIFGRIDWLFSDLNDLRLDGSYQFSRYHDANVFTVAGIPNFLARQDKLFAMNVTFDHRIAQNWKLAAVYQFLHNDSNIAGYQYRSNLFMITCEGQFP